MKRTLLLLFVMVLFSSITFAQPPLQPQISAGVDVLELEIPREQFLKQNENIQYNIHVFNKTTGLSMDNASIACVLDIYNRTGFHVDILNFKFDGNDFELDIDGSNFSTLGLHTFITVCNSTTIGGFTSVSVEVTRTGDEKIHIDFLPIVLLVIFVVGIYFLVLVRFITERQFTEHGLIKLLFYMISFWILLLPLNMAIQYNEFNTGPIIVTEHIELIYQIMVWLNWFIMFYFFLWFIVQILKKLGVGKKLSNE